MINHSHHHAHNPPPSLAELKRRMAWVREMNRKEHCPEKFERPGRGKTKTERRHANG